jgi:prepilin-type processing-associated H-X9-DG protein
MKTIRPRSGLPEGGNRGAGFTLTELAFLLATVALLIVICLPVLAGTRDQTRIAQCADNLKQFTLAMHIYGNENKDQLPSNANVGSWPWDMPWNVGNAVTQWISSRQLYCPGPSVRFTEQDNMNLWNYDAYVNYRSNGTFRVLGYAMTLVGTRGELVTNQNVSTTATSIQYVGYPKMPIVSSQRVLLADATISRASQFVYVLRSLYTWDNVPGGYRAPTPTGPLVPHMSPHLQGKFPAGGNLGMLDGHVEWRKYDSMQCRTDPSQTTVPGFWW